MASASRLAISTTALERSSFHCPALRTEWLNPINCSRRQAPHAIDIVPVFGYIKSMPSKIEGQYCSLYLTNEIS
jgi:hypothetical protein